jgi:Gpi18-like mannosyltransferase
MQRAGHRPEPWLRRDVATLVVVLVAAGVGRLALLPTRGFPDDIDQFVGWVHHIATNGLANAYDQNLTFGPVMAYIWGLLAAVQPAFQTVTDGSDPAISAIMKLPASLADFGLAFFVGYALRDRRRFAVTGAAVVLLHPAVIDVSAWWGQYESIYLLSALAAAILAIEGRLGWAAAAIAISLMTKPQAVPLLIPFAAWFWAVGGWRGVVRAVAIGALVIVVLWLPFIVAGGPVNYVRSLGVYQNDIFNFLSLRAWNVWWLVQQAAGGNFIVDNAPILGPVTLRHVGYALAGGLELVIGAAIIRDPRPRTFILALAASILVVFAIATQMHERYAYGALVFLTLLITEPWARWLSLAFGIVFTLNLLAAIPPTPEIAAVLPIAGSLGVIGSIAMLAITYAAFRMLAARPPGPDAAPAPPGP